jgi:hypothetical protein
MFQLIRKTILTNRLLHIFILCISLLFLIALQISINSSEDFCPNYYAAQHFLQHIPIYSTVSCWKLQYNAYLPIVPLFFIPFTFLSLLHASFVWGILIVIFYVMAGILLLELLRLLSLRSVTLFLFSSLFWQSLLFANIFRNLSQLLLLLITLSWLLRKKHPYTAGILLGIASLLKIWPVLLLAGTLINNNKRTFFAGCGTIVTGILISLAFFTPQVYAIYFSTIKAYENTWINHPDNISLIGAVTKLFTEYPLSPPLITKLPIDMVIKIGYGISIFVLCVTFIFLIWYKMKRKIIHQPLLIEGFLITISLLVFPLVWDWNVILLLLPFTSIVLTLKRLPKQPMWLYMLLGCGVLAILDPVLLINNDTNNVGNINACIHLFVTIALLGFAIGQATLAARIRSSGLTRLRKV